MAFKFLEHIQPQINTNDGVQDGAKSERLQII
jgi:hypothetical protein